MCQSFGVQRVGKPAYRAQPSFRFLSDRDEQRFVLDSAVCGPSENVDHAIARARDDRRQQLAAHPVPQQLRVRIRRVLDPGIPAVLEISNDLVPPEVDERADDSFARRSDRAEAACARAAQQSQQYGFRLIVARVGNRHQVGAEPRACAFEERIPDAACGLLHRFATRRGFAGDVDLFDVEGKSQVGCERPAEFAIANGLIAAQHMIEVRHAHD